MLFDAFPTIIASPITAGNALIDSTTANAFCAPVGVDLTPYRGRLIEFWGGSPLTLWAQAWISATAPSGEPLGDTQILNGVDFTGGPPPTSWTSIRGAVLTGPSGVLRATYFDTVTFGAEQMITITSGRLGRLSVDLVAISGLPSVNGDIRLGSSTQGVQLGRPTPTVGNTSVFYLTESVNIYLGLMVSGGAAGAYVEWDNVKYQQVLTPAATGALLLSSQGGSRGWLYKHASFDPNVALTMRILATRRGNYIC